MINIGDNQIKLQIWDTVLFLLSAAHFLGWSGVLPLDYSFLLSWSCWRSSRVRHYSAWDLYTVDEVAYWGSWEWFFKHGYHVDRKQVRSESSVALMTSANVVVLCLQRRERNLPRRTVSSSWRPLRKLLQMSRRWARKRALIARPSWRLRRRSTTTSKQV